MTCYFVVSILPLLGVSQLLESQSLENGCWPWNVVPFNLDKAFGEDEKRLIRLLMRHISLRTCLRYIDMYSDVSLKELPSKYLEVKKSDGKHCRTLEAQSNGSVVVTLELGSTCTTQRRVLHELVHSLGFRHEHQRVDRKCYVKVYWRFSHLTAFAVNFNHPDSDWIQRFPYDKESIMHYSRTSKMKAKSERWYEWEPLGNWGYLTWWDMWKINYKHCAVHHYCDFHQEQCEAMDEYEKYEDCKNPLKIEN